MSDIIEFKEYGISMSFDQIKSAKRINECLGKGFSHDVKQGMLVQLSNLGLVADKGDGVYEQTDLMFSIIKAVDQVGFCVFSNSISMNLFGVEYGSK